MRTPVWYWNEENEENETWGEGMAEKDDDKWIVMPVNGGEREREMSFDEDQSSMDDVIDRRKLPPSPIENIATGDEILLYKRGEIVGVSPSRETLDGLFPTFASYLQETGNNAVKEALKLMFPISMGKDSESQFITLLLSHTREPLKLVKTATMPLDAAEGVTYAPTRSGYDKGHAARIKFNTGMLFSVENGTFREGQTIYEFYELNKPFFNGFVYAENKFSKEMAVAMEALNSAEQGRAAQPPAQPPAQPQGEWISITIGKTTLPYIQVDAATIDFISEYSGFIVRDNIEAMNNFMNSAANVTTTFTIKIGLTIIQVSIYTLLWLTRYLYNKVTKESGWFGSIINWIVNKLITNQDFLFAGPLQNITDPEPEESKIRRANRIVFTFFYTMIDLLIFIKGNELITQGKPLNPQLPTFIAREPSTWTLKEIFEYGPALYVAVMGNESSSQNYHDSYNQSIRIVTRLLDKRIFDARIKIEALETALTPLAIAAEAPAIREANSEQIKVIRDAIQQLINLGGMTADLEQVLRAGGWIQEPVVNMEGGARKKSSKKRTKKKSKKKTNKRKKAGKRKKSSKRKKTKRKSMKQVKEKLINLINSL